GDPRRRGTRPLEPRHRPGALALGPDGQVPPAQHLPQARGRQPHGGCEVRLRSRPGAGAGRGLAPSPYEKNSATSAPSTRKGPNGIVSLRAARPRRARITTETTKVASIETSAAPATAQPRPAPRTNASFTSPMPTPPFVVRATASATKKEANAAIVHSFQRSGSAAM